MTELTRANRPRSSASGLPRLKDGGGGGTGVAATATESAWGTQPILTIWVPSAASATNVPPLRIAARYAAGRPWLARHT
jgi:hypothetical protein